MCVDRRSKLTDLTGHCLTIGIQCTTKKILLPCLTPNSAWITWWTCICRLCVLRVYSEPVWLWIYQQVHMAFSIQSCRSCYAMERQLWIENGSYGCTKGIQKWHKMCSKYMIYEKDWYLVVIDSRVRFTSVCVRFPSMAICDVV